MKIPQTFLLLKSKARLAVHPLCRRKPPCCTSTTATNPFNMSEKKDITRAPDDNDNLEAGELYGVKTNPNPPTDAVFGEISEDGPNFKSVGVFQYWLVMILVCVVCMTDTLSLHQLGWIGGAGLMTKSSIGLGVLSIPTVFDTLGLIPGIICLIAVGTIITWSGYVVGVFKLRHPEVYGIDDAGYLMFGRWGREVFGAAFCLCMCTFRLLAYTYARSSKEYICLLGIHY